MSGFKRILSLVIGLIGGLVLVEGGLQGMKLAVAMGDASRRQPGSAVDADGVRILCLGACYTIGLGTAPEASFPAQLEQRLDRQAGTAGRGATVYNGGIRGKSIDHFAAGIEPLLVEYQPDIIVVSVNHRTSLDPSPPLKRSVLDRLLLPRMVSLALTAPSEPSAHETDIMAREIAQLEAELRKQPGRPPLLRKLAQRYAGRGDHAAALETLKVLVDGQVPHARAALHMFRHSAAIGQFDDATSYLDAVRSEPEFVAQMRSVQGVRDDSNVERGRDATLHRALDEARIALVEQDWAGADALLTDVLARDPETAEAWYLLGYLDHVLGRPTRRPSEAFLDTDRSFLTPEAQAFERALDAHVARLVTAADRRSAVVVMHTLGATHDQIPVILRVGAKRGVRVIDVQTALHHVEDPDPLFLPTNQLRFSEAGNAWLAEQIHRGLAEAGLVVEP